MNIVELQRNEEKNCAWKASLHLKKKFIIVYIGGGGQDMSKCQNSDIIVRW